MNAGRDIAVPLPAAIRMPPVAHRAPARALRRIMHQALRKQPNIPQAVDDRK